MSKPKRPSPVHHGDVTLSVVRGPHEGRWYWRAKRGRDPEPWPDGLPHWMSAEEARTLPMGAFAAIAMASSPDPGAPTVLDAIGALLGHREALAGRKESTIRIDRWAARQIVGTPTARTEMAARPLCELTTVELSHWLAGLTHEPTKTRPEPQPLSSNSKAKVLALLRASIAFGVRRGWWGPLRADLPAVKPKREMARWAPPEAAVLAYLDWLADNAPRGVWLATRIQAETGCRIGEVAGQRGVEGARWADFDLLAEPAVWHLREGKTGARRVVLSAALAGLLRAEAGRLEQPDGPIAEDKPEAVDGSTWLRLYSLGYVTAMAEQGVLVRRIRTHDLRHRYLSEAVARGVDLKTISAQCGVGVETLLRNYTHTHDQRRAESAEVLSLGGPRLRGVG